MLFLVILTLNLLSLSLSLRLQSKINPKRYDDHLQIQLVTLWKNSHLQPHFIFHASPLSWRVLNYLIFNLNKIFLSHKLQANEFFIRSFSAYPSIVAMQKNSRDNSFGFYFIGLQLNSAFILIFTSNLNYLNFFKLISLIDVAFMTFSTTYSQKHVT